MKGYTIDCKYLVKVVDFMYPRPTMKQYLLGDGEILPLIIV